MKNKLLIVLAFINIFIVFNVEAKYIEDSSMCIVKIEKADTEIPLINGRNFDVSGEVFYNDVIINYEDNTKIKYAKYYFNSEEKEFESGKVFSDSGEYKIEVSDIYGNIVTYSFSIQKMIEKIDIINNEFEVVVTAQDEKDGIEKIIIYVDDEIFFENNYSGSKDECSNSVTLTNSFYQEVYAIALDTENNILESEKIIVNANKIYTKDDLFKFSKIVNSKKCNFENMEVNLMNNLDGIENLEPINGFKGIFNGNNKVISNYTYHLGRDRVGIFETNYGKIKNLEVIGYIQNIGNYISGICAENFGTIYNCKSEVTIKATGGYVSGITSLNHGIVELCKNYGSIESMEMYSGGIVGVNKGKIIECGNSGLVYALGYSGGICGLTEGIENEDVILECFNSGEISGSEFIGGICGGVKDKFVQMNCLYNTGKITENLGQGKNGGILGDNVNYASIKNSYNIGEIVSFAPNQIAPMNNLVYNSYYIKGTENFSRNGTEKEIYLFADTSLDSVLYSLNEECENIWNINSKVNSGYVAFSWQM